MADATIEMEARLRNLVSKDLDRLSKEVDALNQKLVQGSNAVGQASVKADNSLKALPGAISKGNRAASAAALAMGSMGSEMGKMGQVASGAASGLLLLSSAAGPVGIAIAVAVTALGALSSIMSEVNDKAIKESEESMKKATENANRIVEASKIVVAAQKRAQEAAVGDNPMAKLMLQQKAELDSFKGTQDQKVRLLTAYETERDALANKLGSERHERAVKIETDLTRDLAELQITRDKKGAERDIALLQMKQRTKLEAAIAGGAEESFAREVIAEETEIKVAEIEKKYEEEKKARRLQMAEASATLATNSLQFASALGEMEASQVRKNAKEATALIDKKEKQGVISRSEAERQKKELDKKTEARLKALAQRAKAIAIAEALINTALGVTKAFAQGGILGFITGAAVAVAGATQIAKISAQEFAEGGFPEGTNALVRVNEEGQEAVLNAGAVRRLGKDRINSFNRGGSFNDNRSESANAYNYAPAITVQVSGGDPQNIVQALERQRFEFFRFIEESQRKGFKGVA